MSEGEEDPEAVSQAQGISKPGVIPPPGFPSSQFTEHSPFRPLVRLGLEPRLVLEYPEEVEESRGKGPFAWGGPKSPTQMGCTTEDVQSLSPGFQDWQSQASFKEAVCLGQDPFWI